MDNDKNEVIAKIQKLLALANSANEFEASLAAEKANELLTKHNLKLSQIEGYTPDMKCQNFMASTTQQPAENKWIFAILCNYFFVRIVKGRRRNLVNGKVCAVWSFLGDTHNVEIARYVYEFLARNYHDLFKAYREETGCQPNYRSSFYVGLTRGIMEHLDSIRSKVQNETGLVVIPQDPKIKDFQDSIFDKTRKCRSPSVHVVNDDAIERGTEEGRKIRIAKGLNENATNSKLELKKGA